MHVAQGDHDPLALGQRVDRLPHGGPHLAVEDAALRGAPLLREGPPATGVLVVGVAEQRRVDRRAAVGPRRSPRLLHGTVRLSRTPRFFAVLTRIR